MIKIQVDGKRGVMKEKEKEQKENEVMMMMWKAEIS